MRKLAVVFTIALFALILNGAAVVAQELDEPLDHVTQLMEFTTNELRNIVSAVVTDENIITWTSGDTYTVYSLTGSQISRTDAPTELTGIFDLDWDGTYVYGVNQYGQRSRVYRWLPDNLSGFALVTEAGEYYRGIAVDPATLDIYLIDQQPSYIEKLTHQDDNTYSRTYLGASAIYQPSGLAWIPNEPNGRNLAVLHRNDSDDNGEYEMYVLQMEPDLSNRTTSTMLLGDESAGGGAACGLSTTWEWDPARNLLVTVGESYGIDLWEMTENTGTGDLTVYVQNQLTYDTVVGATVNVYAADGSVEATATVDESGELFFEDLTIGLKRVQTTFEGFSPDVDDQVRVLIDGMTYVTANLLPFGGGYQVGGQGDDYSYIRSVGDLLTLESDGSATLSLTNPFTFYEVEYNSILISKNGIISFDTDADLSGTPAALPVTDGPNNIIAVYWSDLSVGQDQGIMTYYRSSDDVTIIDYSMTDSNSNNITFQIVLKHSSNRISVLYNNGGFDTLGGIAGVQNADGTSYTNVTSGFREDGGWTLHWVVNAVDEPSVTVQPTGYSLSEVYPNPFNPTAMARVQLAAPGNLRVVLFNSLGRQVAEIAQGNFSAGSHNFVIDGRQLSSGVYFVNATIPGTFNQTRRITLVK